MLSTVFLYHLLTLSHRHMHVNAPCMGCCRVLTWNIVLQPLSRTGEQVQTEFAPGWLSKGCLRASQEGKDHKGLFMYPYMCPYGTAQARARDKGLSSSPHGRRRPMEPDPRPYPKSLPNGSRSGSDLPPKAQRGKEKEWDRMNTAVLVTPRALVIL